MMKLQLLKRTAHGNLSSPSIGTSSKFETLPRRVRSLNEIYESFNVAYFACEP